MKLHLILVGNHLKSGPRNRQEDNIMKNLR